VGLADEDDRWGLSPSSAAAAADVVVEGVIRKAAMAPPDTRQHSCNAAARLVMEAIILLGQVTARYLPKEAHAAQCRRYVL